MEGHSRVPLPVCQLPVPSVRQPHLCFKHSGFQLQAQWNHLGTLEKMQCLGSPLDQPHQNLRQWSLVSDHF